MTASINTADPVRSSGTFTNNQHRGIASLTFKGRTLRFRTNPNEIWWSYGLNTHVEETYGGRVVQILSTRIEDLVIKVDCGRGGWDYMKQVVDFLRKMMVEQREKGGTTATFNYTTRHWRMKVFALSVPFQDSVTAVNRELTLQFKVQEDVSGVMSQMALDQTLQRLKDGIGMTRPEYVKPNGGQSGESPQWASTEDAVDNLLGGTSPLPFGGGSGGFLGIPGLPGI